jgi:hypothetical protein
VKYIFCFFLINVSAYAYGIDSTKMVNKVDVLKKDTMDIWIPAAITGLNISQIAFSNWTQGGSDAFTWTASGNIGLDYRGEVWTFRNRLKVGYGRTKLGGQGSITNDNDFNLENVLSFDIGWATDPYFSNSIVTTIAEGYSYSTNPPVPTADFFDPGYVTQSIGFTYNKLQSLTTRLGFASQEVFTNRFRQYTDNPATTNKVEAFKFETGIESVTQEKLEIADNVILISGLRLFSRFENLDIWDVRWDNTVNSRINSFLNVHFDYQLVYQRDQSLRTQAKEGLQLGVVYTIF